jgi:hypothetical protein
MEKNMKKLTTKVLFALVLLAPAAAWAADAAMSGCPWGCC